MEKKTLLMGTALAALAMTGCSGMGAKSDGGMSSVECHGVNACKGTGECGGVGHGCAGQNACKGKGWIKKSADECKAMGGTFKGK